MLEICKIGEDTEHDSSFLVDRAAGHPVYLVLLVKTKAEFWTGEKWTLTEPGICVVFKPGQKHLYRAAENTYMDDWMHIETDIDVFGEFFPFGYPVRLGNRELYYQLFHLLYDTFFMGDTGNNTVCHHLLIAFCEMLRQEAKVTETSNLYYELIELRKEIYRHPELPWKVTDMAKRLNICDGYLQMLYKKYFQISCMKDVIESRLETAEELLLSGNKPIVQISEECGYSNQEHFIRQFQKKYGSTPGKYRKQHNL